MNAWMYNVRNVMMDELGTGASSTSIAFDNEVCVECSLNYKSNFDGIEHYYSLEMK